MHIIQQTKFGPEGMNEFILDNTDDSYQNLTVMVVFQPINEPLQDATAVVDEKGETYWIHAQHYAQKSRKNHTYGDILKPSFRATS
jgi:hypothetical protein